MLTFNELYMLVYNDLGHAATASTRAIKFTMQGECEHQFRLKEYESVWKLSYDMGSLEDLAKKMASDFDDEEIEASLAGVPWVLSWGMSDEPYSFEVHDDKYDNKTHIYMIAILPKSFSEEEWKEVLEEFIEDAKKPMFELEDEDEEVTTTMPYRSGYPD